MGAGSWVLWCTGPGLGIAIGSGVLKHQAFWSAELSPGLASYLAWSVPVLMPKGWWVGLGPGINKLEGGFQNSVWQHRVHGIEQVPKDGCYQALCLQGEIHLSLSGRLSKISGWF